MWKGEPAWRALSAAFGLSTIGRVVHDIEEFGRPSSDAPVTVLLIPLALGFAWWNLAGHRMRVVRVMMVWIALQLVGAAVTILPLAILPFSPAQTLGHWIAHAIYAAGQLGAISILWRMLRGTGHHASSA